MNNFSPLPAAASDSRRSTPEAVAPNQSTVSPALEARRQKLRRVVAWVVGGATLLMCIGLVRAAFRSHSAHVAEAAAAASMPAPVAPLATVAAVAPQPAPSASEAALEPAPAASVAAKPAKMASWAGHATLSPKNAKRTTLSKSIRH
jgi:hypothetical protein